MSPPSLLRSVTRQSICAKPLDFSPVDLERSVPSYGLSYPKSDQRELASSCAIGGCCPSLFSASREKPAPRKRIVEFVERARLINCKSFAAMSIERQIIYELLVYDKRAASGRVGGRRRRSDGDGARLSRMTTSVRSEHIRILFVWIGGFPVC